LHDAGHFDLPPQMLARRQAETRIVAASRAGSTAVHEVNPAAVRSRIVAAIIEAAGSDDLPAGYAAPFLEEQDNLRRLAAEQSILDQAKYDVADRTPYVVMKLSEQI